MSSEPDFSTAESFAWELDAADPLADLRQRFHIPKHDDGEDKVYLCGNSLGLQCDGVAACIERELSAWSTLAVDAHFQGEFPWYSYHEPFRGPLAQLVGAHPEEVVATNGLTANLHLLMTSFYRPTPQRFRVVMEDCAFPSDTYAVHSQIRLRGFDPDEALQVVRPGSGQPWIETEQFEEALQRDGESVALVLLPGVSYYTGQRFDIQRITAAARRCGARVGWDLAHAVGNVPLELHAWDVDFAVWCSYKYLNGGPGGVAGAFVHRRHLGDPNLQRLAGWWGNDPATRFRMHLEREFKPVASADAWQLSNPPILALAPLRASLQIFDEVGMQALRTKSLALTAYAKEWLDRGAGSTVEILTPQDPEARGCQWSLRILERPKELFDRLQAAGVVVDFRPPDVIRAAPVPLYNGFHDLWRVGQVLEAWQSRWN